MLTLPDPKHEAFATLRASGHDVAAAYIHAGYSVKNVKTRARKLVRNPNIQARIEHLKTCLPRIEELHEHHCPTLLLMPETRHEMLVWLWQVMNGTRLIKPAQMRAATLYCRLQGWHLAKLLPQAQPQAQAGCPTAVPDTADQSPIPTSTLTEAEKIALAFSNQENLDHERTGQPRSPENLAIYQSALATLALPHAKKDPFGRPLPDLISKSTPDPVPTTTTAPPASPSAPTAESPQTTSVRPVSPVSSSPSTPQSPSPRSKPHAPSSKLQAGPPPESPSQPTLPQRLTPVPSPTPHFIFRSKADPVSAGPPPLLPLSICSS